MSADMAGMLAGDVITELHDVGGDGITLAVSVLPDVVRVVVGLPDEDTFCAIHLDPAAVAGLRRALDTAAWQVST